MALHLTHDIEASEAVAVKAVKADYNWTFYDGKFKIF